MWKGKLKAVTFSFDDGVTQDVKMIELLDKYGLKATFNLNSGTLGCPNTKYNSDGSVAYTANRVEANKIKSIYAGHEVASPTLVHPNLTQLEDSAVTYQMETDRQVLSELCGYDVVGFAYPCGGVNNDDRVAEIIKNTTGLKYGRTNGQSYNFELPENRLRFTATMHFYNSEDLMNYGKKFIELSTDTPKVFSVWGHTFELDTAGDINWEKFEEFCKLISGRDDIFYGTNKEVLLLGELCGKAN